MIGVDCIGSFYETQASDLTHPPQAVSLTMAQTAPHFVPSVPSHSSMSGHGWISDPLPLAPGPTSRDSVRGMPTTISSSDLQQRLHNQSFIVSHGILVFSFVLSI
jgi:hypothetical protein